MENLHLNDNNQRYVTPPCTNIYIYMLNGNEQTLKFALSDRWRSIEEMKCGRVKEMNLNWQRRTRMNRNL